MSGAWQPRGEGDLRVGLVGLGAMGRNHARVLGELDGVKLVAIADPSRDALASVAGDGVATFEDPERLSSYPAAVAKLLRAATALKPGDRPQPLEFGRAFAAAI